MGLLQSSSDESGSATSMERPRKRQQQDLQPPAEKLKCPRCDSTNTKFCYYNNYNKSQPRHFCKSCKRHWTKGGMLRNVPVGGGRKNKRLKTSESLTITTHTNTKTGIGANIHVSGSSFGFQDSDQRLSQNQTILGHGSFFSSFNESNFNGLFGGSSTLQNHELQFPSPSLGSLDASGHISNLYGLSGLEESVMTGLNDKPWPSRESTATNWVWDDIDKFVSCDVSVPWDDAEIEYP